MYFVHDHVSPVIEPSVERIIHLIRVRFVFDTFPFDGAHHTFDTRQNRIRLLYDYHVLMTC